MSRVCIIQFPTLSMSPSRIDYYLKIVKDNGASLALLGEYVLNSFFTELIKMPQTLIDEQILDKKNLMSELAIKYNLDIIAPFVMKKNDFYIKGVAKFSPNSFDFWEQNFLINYKHWDERSFFKNNKEKLDLGIFENSGFKFGVMNGFDTHFDICWQYFLKNKVEVVLVPSACVFNSNLRWEELLKVRAFTNLCYVLRANRIGKAKFMDNFDNFYGDSFAVSPNGVVSSRLKDEEGILLFELSKDELKVENERWKFRDILDNKGFLK
ncbi:carbon-nitrogen hydrolase family protein [Campylobacter sp. FMV-PI01]|uniref:Carbon-nitrogen hydrolase family protein n=1 Tax=Campylobacter portucalensis TaxID=2608384 RepID=A0A6L5WLD3_9BACT|nr:carbon-nitrogen hydrolase family protein [Campylobacter portucalensis]MSN96521.1 carbon-nitrogen hydrolase family protein [Campylobacter portucalensis]